MPNNFDEHLEKNGEYWKSRFEKIEESAVNKGAKYYDSLDKEFRKAEKAIDAKINAWYQRFANNNEISLSEARKLLNSDELEEFKWNVEDYIKYGQENAFTQEWMKELENASAKVHISRLEALKLQLQQEAEVLYGNQLDGIDKLARDIYTDTYYHTAFEVQKGFNVGWDFQRLDNRRLDKVISKPWTADGNTFSDKLWTQQKDLINTVHTELTQAIMRGSAPDKAIDAISRKFQVSKGKAGRLVMTESAYFSSVAQKDCFKELDVEKFEIVATLDSHTSELCQSMDGVVQDMKDFEPGVTAPPFHPWCRSTTVPYFDDDEGYRAARGEDGKTYYVPSDMKYGDWKECYVDKTKDPSKWEKPQPKTEIADKTTEFVEVKDAKDFAYGNYTEEDFFKWEDDYAEHNANVKLTDEELKIIEDYSEGGYIGFNGVSRNPDSLLKKGFTEDDIAKYRKKADVLEDVLGRYDLDTDIVTHRFERDVSWLTGNGNSVEELEKLIGTEYTADGFTSSSMFPMRSRFGGGKSDAVHFEIVTPEGTNGAYLSMSKKGEEEFLYNRNTKFKVLDGGERVVKEQHFNIKTMQMEEIEVKERFLKVQAIPDNAKHIDVPKIEPKVEPKKIANKVVQNVSEDVKVATKTKPFIPAKTIEEAEDFISEYVDDSKFGALGVSYSGVDVDVANEINRTVSKFMDTFNVDKFGGIVAPPGNTKLGKAIDGATAGYSPVRSSFILNRKSMKNLKTATATFEKEHNAIKGILEHPEKYDFSKLGKRVRAVVERSKISGRSIVPKTIEEALNHELGHMLEKQVYKSPYWKEASENMPKFADKISGYAGESSGEYIAESMASYLKGEDVIDPTLKKIFESLKR